MIFVPSDAEFQEVFEGTKNPRRIGGELPVYKYPLVSKAPKQFSQKAKLVSTNQVILVSMVCCLVFVNYQSNGYEHHELGTWLHFYEVVVNVVYQETLTKCAR